MKRDEMLVPRLNFLIPMNFFLSQEWQLNFGVDSKTAIGRVVGLNPEWAIAVVNNLEHRLTDVLHDFKGIYSEDEHFLPRIAGEEFETDEEDNEYTNIQTYRLCVVLDNEEVANPLKRFLELVQEDEFESNDIDIINWNEVITRYSDSILLEHNWRFNK